MVQNWVKGTEKESVIEDVRKYMKKSGEFWEESMRRRIEYAKETGKTETELGENMIKKGIWIVEMQNEEMKEDMMKLCKILGDFSRMEKEEKSKEKSEEENKQVAEIESMSKTETEEKPEITAETEAETEVVKKAEIEEDELEVESIEKVGGEDKEIIDDLECDEQREEIEREERIRRNKAIRQEK